MDVSVIGLGKLGLCTAACFAAKGHRVVGVEKEAAILEALQMRCCPIPETGLEELLGKAWDNLTVTHDPAEALSRSDITLVVVPTPSLADGRFTSQYVEAALRELAPALAVKTTFHVVGVVSTVMPGSSGEVFCPLLENLTNKSCGVDFGLVYNPEFIALGSVLHDFLNPDLVLIGESDSRSGALVEELYLATCENKPCMARMGLVSAEIAKLAINCYVTMKISFVNELASVVERVGWADVDAISAALGADSRIGPKCLKPGLGFGGPCLPRDNLAFQAFARQYGTDVQLGPQILEINRRVCDRLYSLVTSGIQPGARIAIFGLSYKPSTPIVEESQSLQLARFLSEAGYEVWVHDPEAMDTARKLLGDSVAYAADPYEAARDASAIVLLTRWPQYETLDWVQLSCWTAPNAVLIDAWRLLRGKDRGRMRYMALGLDEGRA